MGNAFLDAADCIFDIYGIKYNYLQVVASSNYQRIKSYGPLKVGIGFIPFFSSFSPHGCSVAGITSSDAVDCIFDIYGIKYNYLQVVASSNYRWIKSYGPVKVGTGFLPFDGYTFLFYHYCSRIEPQDTNEGRNRITTSTEYH